eukprot:192388_1
MFAWVKDWKSWLFIAFGSLTILWIILYFTNGITGYIAAAAVCIVMSIFAIFDFRDIFHLKEQIDKAKQLNEEFKGENDEMKKAVDGIGEMNTKLSVLSGQFNENNKTLANNIKNLERFVEEFKAEGDDMDNKQSDVVNKCQRWLRAWKKEAADNVRRVLDEAFEAADASNNDMLDRDEYKVF